MEQNQLALVISCRLYTICYSDSCFRCDVKTEIFSTMLFSSTVRDCQSLPNITNGAVDLSEGTTFSSVAVYSCDGGYELQGDPVRMCNESGVWNGREPTCIPIGSEPTSTGKKL